MGINGFGRIGRFVFRSTFLNNANKAKVTAINDPFMSLDYLVYLLKYDSVHGRFPGSVEKADGGIKVNGDFIKVFHETDPTKIGWGSVGADYVCESTGVFLSQEKGALHIAGGAKKVVLSAPPKDSTPIYVVGVNHDKYSPSEQVVSNASCTTNCLAPLVAPIQDQIASGIMTTVHAVTGDQTTIDMPHKDWRRGRIAYRSIIPTATGAAAAIGLVIPSLQGKLDGFALRVPTDNVSLVDLTLQMKEPVSVETLHALYTEQSQGPLQGILALNNTPLVSIDFNHTTASSILDLTQTRVQGTTVKLLSWYDNEWGFANRMLDTAQAMQDAG